MTPAADGTFFHDEAAADVGGKTRTYRVLFPFCGLGAGALGFIQGEARLLGMKARFKSVGGIDLDPEACQDFEYLTGSPSLCANIATMTVEELRAFAGEEAPEVVFSSPPCTGFTTLINDAKSEEQNYQELNALVVTWVKLMLATWEKSPPKLFLIENVPNIARRGAPLLKVVKALLKKAGYLFHEGFHDCGELGGLAQHRRRFLLVARHAASLKELLYQPPTKRVRGCGEVVGLLPLPGSPEAGPMHVLPSISVRNWIRLALIPPGKDWHAIGPAIEDLRRAQAAPSNRRAFSWAIEGSFSTEDLMPPQGAWHNGYFGLRGWGDSAYCVTGNARHSTGPFSIADGRMSSSAQNGALGLAAERFRLDGLPVGPGEPYAGVYGVCDQVAPVPAITGRAQLTTGSYSYADERVFVGLGVTDGTYKNAYGVAHPEEPSLAVTGAARPSCGAFSFADERLLAVGRSFNSAYGVCCYGAPSPAILGENLPSNGFFSLADENLREGLRVGGGHPWTYGVMHPGDPAHAVTSASSPGCGPFSFADGALLAKVDSAVDAARPSRAVPSKRRGRAMAPAERRRGVAATRARRRSAGPPPAVVVLVPDLRVPGAPALRFRYYARDLDDKPAFVPLLCTKDGSWHRPFTTLELAVLQGLPASVRGAPLKLAGSSVTGWRKRIGNAVPPPTARAVGEKMLVTLLGAEIGAFSLSSDKVWVTPRHAGVPRDSVWRGARIVGCEASEMAH